MVWVRSDDALPDDPRVVATGAIGAGVIVLCLAYSNRNLSNGWVPAPFVRRFLPSNDEAAAHIDALVRTRILQPLEQDGIDGFLLHADYVGLQPSRDDVLKKRSRRSQVNAVAGRLGGIKSGKAKRKQKQSELGALGEPGGSDRKAPIPIPIPEEKSTAGAAMHPHRLDEATSDMLTRLFHEVWDRESSTADRVEAVKCLLPNRGMYASVDAISNAERRVSHLRSMTASGQRQSNRGGGFARVGDIR